MRSDTRRERGAGIADTSRECRRRPRRGGSPARLIAAAAVVIGFLAFVPARAAITFVKNIGTNESATAGTTISVTVPAGGVAAGNTIILALAMQGAAGTVSATDTASNTYTVAADVTNGSNVRTVI